MSEASFDFNELRAELGIVGARDHPAAQQRPSLVTAVRPVLLLRDVVQRGGEVPCSVDDGVRAGLAAVTAAAGVGGALDFWLTNAVTGGSWWQRWAAGFRWPAVWMQPIMLTIALVVLLSMACLTRGFSYMVTAQLAVATGCCIVTGLAVLPLILFLVGWAFFIALCAACVMAIAAALIAIVAGAFSG